MSTDTTATETKIETIATQSKTEDASNKTPQEVDYESELTKVNAELAQTKEEKENYRKAYLKERGNKPDVADTTSNGEDLDATIQRKVQEALLATREAEALAKKDKLIVDMAKKTKELTLALKNRGQVTSPSGQGSNEDKPEVKVETILSQEQINKLKAKGWDDKKIETFKKNLLNPQAPK